MPSVQPARPGTVGAGGAVPVHHHEEPTVSFKEHPTQAWPRPSRTPRTARLADQADAGTRLDIARAFSDADGIAEPTRPVPVVPMPDRRTQPPVVKPIPHARRGSASPRPAAAVQAPDPVADPDEGRAYAADFINRVMDDQAALNAAHSRRMDRAADALHGVRRIGPGGLLGWRPLQAPNVHEVAAARSKIAEAEERRRHAHQRHLDILETVRAYLALLCLVALLALVAGAAYLAFGILAGWYAWSPTAV